MKQDFLIHKENIKFNKHEKNIKVTEFLITKKTQKMHTEGLCLDFFFWFCSLPLTLL